MAWVAGVPRLTASWQNQTGRVVTFDREKIWALSNLGRIEPVVDYQLNSAAGRDLIRLAAGLLGFTERWPLSMKIGIFFALLTIIGFVVGGPVLLALGQSVWFGLLFTEIGIACGGLLWLLLRLTR